MKIQLMDIQRQHETYAKEYEEAAVEVLRTGKYIGGKEVTGFENEFAAYMGAEYAISCGNGTDAIIIALRALGIGKDDEVITVPWTFFATAESIAAVGAKPVFVDVDKETYCMDVSLVEASITNMTKAILTVQFYGNCTDMISLHQIAEKYGIFIITDCAQAAGTQYRGLRKNILGDISCFSFFPTKNLGCAGDGGMILTDNENFARACRALRVHGSGMDGFLTAKESCEQAGEIFLADLPEGEPKYYNYLVGYNSRLDAIQAAILRRKLVHLDEFVSKRRNNAAKYNDALKETAFKTPTEEKNTDHSFYIYALKHPNAEKIIKALKEKEIACGTYYPVPLHLQKAFSSLGYRKGDFPVTEELARTTFAIPVFPELFDYEQEYIIDTLINLNNTLTN